MEFASIYKSLRVFNLWMMVIVVCSLCALSERALSHSHILGKTGRECINLFSELQSTVNPRTPGQAPRIYGYPAEVLPGKIFTFPSGTRQPPGQVKIGFGVPKPIAKRTQAALDQELSRSGNQNDSWWEKVYFKIKARKSVLARDFVGQNEFKMDGIDLYFDNSYSGLEPGHFGYYVGHDLRVYVQIELKGQDHSYQAPVQWRRRGADYSYYIPNQQRIAKAVIQAVVDPYTGDYSEIQIIESKFEIRTLFSTI